MRSGADISIGDATVSLYGSLSWKYGFDNLELESRHAFVGGGSAFTIYSVPLARNTAEVEVGAVFHVSHSSTLSVRYQGEFASGAEAQGVRLGWDLRF